MDIYKQKFTKQEQIVFRFLCIHAGKEFHIRAIARELNVSATGVSKVIRKFERLDLVKINREFLLRVSLNRNNLKVINMKRIENLQQLYESGFVEFVSDKFPGTTVVVFGSFAFGEDTFVPESDVDIAVIGMKEADVQISEFEILFKRKINLLFFQDFRKIETNLRDNILNGIVLNGHIEL